MSGAPRLPARFWAYAATWAVALGVAAALTVHYHDRYPAAGGRTASYANVASALSDHGLHPIAASGPFVTFGYDHAPIRVRPCTTDCGNDTLTHCGAEVTGVPGAALDAAHLSAVDRLLAGTCTSGTADVETIAERVWHDSPARYQVSRGGDVNFPATQFPPAIVVLFGSSTDAPSATGQLQVYRDARTAAIARDAWFSGLGGWPSSAAGNFGDPTTNLIQRELRRPAVLRSCNTLLVLLHTGELSNLLYGSAEIGPTDAPAGASPPSASAEVPTDGAEPAGAPAPATASAPVAAPATPTLTPKQIAAAIKRRQAARAAMRDLAKRC